MYLFLVIYSVFNLNVVSWGTREVPKKKTPEELEAEQKQAEEEAKKTPKKRGIFGWFQSERWMQYKVAKMWNNNKGGVKGSLDTILRRLEAIERALRREGYEMAPVSKKIGIF